MKTLLAFVMGLSALASGSSGIETVGSPTAAAPPAGGVLEQKSSGVKPHQEECFDQFLAQIAQCKSLFCAKWPDDCDEIAYMACLEGAKDVLRACIGS